MFKSMRKRLSQSGSRPNVGAASSASREHSVDLAEHRSLEDGIDGDFDCDDSDDPFESANQLDQPPASRSATLDRRRLRRLHSASSATTMDRIETATDSGKDKQAAPLGLKQRAKNFLFRRRSFSSLADPQQHRVDSGGGGKGSARFDPGLVSEYAARRHHSDDCVLDAGDSRRGNGSHGNSNGNGIDNGGGGGGGGGGSSGKKRPSKSLNFFASMRRRGRSLSASTRSSRQTCDSVGVASSVASSSEGGWTEPGGPDGEAAAAAAAGGSGSSTLGRRGHRNSEQYMAPPQAHQQQLHHQHQQQYQLTSEEFLSSNLNELGGLCLERNNNSSSGGSSQLGTRVAELLANWPTVQLEMTPAWLVGGKGGGIGKLGSGSGSKRHSMAVYGSTGPGSAPFNTGSLNRRAHGVAGASSGGPGGSNLAAASAISHSTAEQLHLLCRQFNQAVTLRRSYRSKENLTGRLQRRSSGNWSASSGSSSGRTVESKSFTKQLSNATTASKDSALELKFEEESRRTASSSTNSPVTPPSPSSSGVGAQFTVHHQQHVSRHHGQPIHYHQGMPAQLHQHQHQHPPTPPTQQSPRHHQLHQHPTPIAQAAAAPPVPPRRSTSLRRGGGGGDDSDSGPASPTYLNQTMSLATISAAATTSYPMTSSASQPLDQISEAPDDPDVNGSSSRQPRRSATAVAASQTDEHQHPQHQRRHQPRSPSPVYRRWQGAMPYQTTATSAAAAAAAAATPPPPPRPRQPLLPTPSAMTASGGDSAARIVREARAKLSQLNRLSAELAARKQLRPGQQQQPQPCPFDALSSAPGVATTTVARSNGSNGNNNSSNNNNSNWRNSLLLQDEAAVREYLKDLTAVCATDYC